MEPSQNGSDDRIAKVRGGDRQALAAAFDKYRPRLEKTVRFRLDPRLAGRLDTDDILQEAYLNASQRCGHVEGSTEQSLFIWLRLIVQQTLADLHRRHLGAQKRDADREIALNPQAQTVSATRSMARCLAASVTSPSLALQRVELGERLRGALEQMEPLDQEVLAMRHFEELANKEIAEALGIEQKAASIRYIRALRRLKEILADISGLNSWPGRR